MEWGRLYANLPDDPRVQAAEDNGGAGWLLIESICYCTRAESEGFIPHTQVERLGGGPKKKQKIAALVREGIWLVVEGGYLLDPMLWSEERNLSDQAEKKREADRKRIALKRAAEKAAQNGHRPDENMSRDSRATCSATEDTANAATCSGDSRGPEERREELPKADLVSHPLVADARQADDDDSDELATAVIGAVRERTGRTITAPEAHAVAAKVLARADAKGLVVHHLPRYAASAVASERDLYASLLLDEPPSLNAILHDPDPSRPPWCGDCDEETRQLDRYGDQPKRCPRCHPNPIVRTA